MTRPSLLRLGLTAGFTALLLAAVPASAEAPTPFTTVGSPSVPGTLKGFDLVGHNALGNRGMNSPLAVAGSCAYVGDRSYDQVPRPGSGIAIVDISHPETPTQVGTIAARGYSTQRELRADRALGLLIVEDYSPYIGGAGTAYSGNDLQIYDISADCTKPKLLSTYDFGARTPHEFFLWKDPQRAGRMLAYVTTTIYSPDLNVIDLSDPTAPKLVTVYTAPQQVASGTGDVAASQNPSSYMHSISVNDDGTRAYVGGWDYGTYVLDTSAMVDTTKAPVLTPLSTQVLDYGGNVHGTIKIPGKPYGVMVQEEYAAAGRGCPFGWLRMADMTDPKALTLAGGYRLPENDCDAAKAANGTFTAHNATPFPSVTLLTWYSGGLRAVDTTNPYRPIEAGVFVPKATGPAPAARDARLFFAGSTVDKRTGALWSYPVVQDGLIYVVDIDLGLYVLRYTGPHAEEISKAPFVEGNSSPSRFTAKDPVLTRSATSAATIAKVVALQTPVVVRDTRPLPAGPAHHAAWRWFC